MKDIIEVNICKDHTWECATSVLSRAGEGGTTQFQLKLTDGKMSNYSVHLDFEMPNGETFRSDPLEVENNVAYYDIPVYLLKESGELKVQLILEKPTGEIWRSLIKRYFVLDSIYGLNDIPIIPVGKIEITDTKEHNAEQYAVAQVKDDNLVPNKILAGTTILGVEGTHNCDGEFNLQEKESTIEENGNIEITTDPQYDAMSKVKLNVNVKPNLQEGKFAITKNGEYEIAPEIGFDGLSKVKGTVNVKPNLQEKTATKNEHITADDGYDGLSGVTVEVQPKLQDKTATSNGTVYPDSGYDGLSSVVVGVPETIPNDYLKPEGTKEITQNGDHDVSKYARAYVKVFDSQPILQQKVVNITENNSETVIDADSNYDGLSKVQINVSVPETIVPEPSSGAELNIAYGETEPSDTSKLWIKLENEPSKVEIGNSVDGGNQTLDYSIATLPSDMSRGSAGVVGPKVYLFGGDGLKTINVFDTETNTIETLSTTLPTATYGMASGVVGPKIYLFGGKGLKTINVFDTETNTIETLSTTLPKVILNMASGVVGTKIYLFGGYGRVTTYTDDYLNTIYVFDTETNTIETLSTTLPTSAGYMASGVIGTKIYLFGGLSPYLNTINVFDAETNTIETLSTTLPTATYGMASGVVGPKIYLFGGNGLKTINVFNDGFIINNGTLFLLNQNASSIKIPLINTDTINFELGFGMALLGNENNIGEEVDALLYKTYDAEIKYYTSSATQLESGTELTASVKCNIGDLVVACIVTRDTLILSEGWELVSTSNINSTDTAGNGQRLSWAYKIAEDTTESITVTQATAQRLYINMVALQGAGDVVDNGYSYRDDETSGSLTVEKPSGLVLWGMSSVYSSGRWTTSNGIPIIQLDSASTPRLALGLDQSDEESVTFNAPDTGTTMIVGCLTVQGMSKFYDKYEVNKWEKIKF